MATSRALRVGIVLAERLVEERIFQSRSAITFGQSLRCALSVPVEGVPREHVLFTYEDGHFALHATSAMQVRTVEGERRGTLTIGDATILFQEIAAPPRVPRPRLPASIRGTLADRVDRRLAAIVGGSLVLHIAIATWAWTNDIVDRPLGSPPATLTYQGLDVALDLTPPIAPPAYEPGVATPAAPKQTPAPIVSRVTPDPNALASILTGDERDEHGTGGMSPRQPGADLDKQLDEARHRTITIGDGSHTSRTDNHANADTRHDQLVDNPQRFETPTHRPEDLKGRIDIGPVNQETTSTLMPKVVIEWITTRYMAGLQHCYRLGLNQESTLSGRVRISFTIDDRGKVIDPDASGVSDGVAACIATRMTAWRFPIPKDKDGAPTDATYAVSLALQPN